MTNTIIEQIFLSGAASEVSRRKSGVEPSLMEIQLGFPATLIGKWIEFYLSEIIKDAPFKTIKQPDNQIGLWAPVSFATFDIPDAMNKDLACDDFDFEADRTPGIGNLFVKPNEFRYGLNKLMEQPEIALGVVLWLASLWKLSDIIAGKHLPDKARTTDYIPQNLTERTADFYRLFSVLAKDNIDLDTIGIAASIAVYSKKSKPKDDKETIVDNDINGAMEWFYEKGGYRGHSGSACPARILLHRTASMTLFEDSRREASSLVHCTRTARHLIKHNMQWGEYAVQLQDEIEAHLGKSAAVVKRDAKQNKCPFAGAKQQHAKTI